MVNKGLTPRELFNIVQKQSEDGVEDEENFIVYFNRAIDRVNVSISTSFPRIVVEDMDIPYPNISIEPTYNISGISNNLGNKIEIQPKRSYNFETWIKWLEFATTDDAKDSSMLGVYQIEGGNLDNQTLNKNLYRIIIKLAIKDGVILVDNLVDIFKVIRLTSGDSPLTFGFVQTATSITLYVKPLNIIERPLKELSMVRLEESNETNVTIKPFPEIDVKDRIVETLPNLYSSLEYYRRQFALHSKWSSELFVPIMMQAIGVYEGDINLIATLELNVKNALNSFRNEVKQILPPVLYNPNKKYGDLNK